jgi:hypothetical protein
MRKATRRDQLGSMHIWEGSIKMNFREINFEDVNWFRIQSIRMLL